MEVILSISGEVQLVPESKFPVCISNNILIIASFKAASFCKKSILFWSVFIVSYSGMLLIANKLLFIGYESQYILQQPGSLKSLVMWTYIYVLGCWNYNWTLFLWCPRVSKCNGAAKEIYIQIPNAYKKSLHENVYIRCWLLTWKYLVTRETVRERIFTSLAVGKNSLGSQRVKNFDNIPEILCTARKTVFLQEIL